MIAKDGEDIDIPAVLIGMESAVVLRRIMELMEQHSNTYATARMGDGLVCGYDEPCPSLTTDEVCVCACVCGRSSVRAACVFYAPRA